MFDGCDSNSRLDTSGAELAAVGGRSELRCSVSGSTDQREEEGRIEACARDVLCLGDGGGQAVLVGAECEYVVFANTKRSGVLAGERIRR